MAIEDAESGTPLSPEKPLQGRLFKVLSLVYHANKWCFMQISDGGFLDENQCWKRRQWRESTNALLCVPGYPRMPLAKRPCCGQEHVAWRYYCTRLEWWIKLSVGGGAPTTITCFRVACGQVAVAHCSSALYSNWSTCTRLRATTSLQPTGARFLRQMRMPQFSKSLFILPICTLSSTLLCTSTISRTDVCTSSADPSDLSTTSPANNGVMCAWSGAVVCRRHTQQAASRHRNCHRLPKWTPSTKECSKSPSTHTHRCSHKPTHPTHTPII